MLKRILLCLPLLAAGTPGAAAPSSITEITVTDQLGYACIDPAHLEEPDGDSAALAFQLIGKLKLPRTCMPTPCARPLNKRELSGVTGTSVSHPRFMSEWDDYYARYAEYCRKEVTPFGDGKPLLDEKAPPAIGPGNFWTPLISPKIVTDDIITRIPPTTISPLLRAPAKPLLPVASNPRIPNGEACQSQTSSTNYWAIRENADPTICRGGSGSASLSSVPLPGPLGLLIGGVGLMGLVARHRPRKI